MSVDWVKFLKLRMEGLSLQESAVIVGCTKQWGDVFLQKICPNKRELNAAAVRYPEFDPDTLDMLLHEIVRCKGSVPDICAAHDVEEDDVRNLVNYLALSKIRPMKSCAYPAVAKWMQKHVVSVRQMAKIIDEPAARTIRVLFGYEHMKVDFARKLKKCTGLSMTEIFEPYISQADDAA